MPLHYRKYVAELLGTFTLTLAVALSLSHTAIVTPIVAGLTLGLFVYTVGSVSGAHLNPAITVAIASVRRISQLDAIAYIVAQVLGAALALLVVATMSENSGGLVVTETLSTGIMEAAGTFMLGFGVASVIYGKIQSAASGLVIGGSLVLGITIAGSMTNGVLNPAVALGIGSFSFMYLIGPIVGALAGVWAYKYLAQA